MPLSPIVLFVYNRPDHTRKTLQALAAADLAEQSILYVYADGPRPFATAEEMQRIAEVREVVKSQAWCGEFHLIESDWNRGLADSVVRGVTEVVRNHGRVIVLEDDIVMSRGFLRYMNDALNLYEDDPKVMHISGMIFGTAEVARSTTAFLRILSCHGWATWARAWMHYEDDATALLERLRAQGITRRKFDIEGHATFYRQLLKNSDGTLKTWAVKWYASWLTAGGYSLFPHRSLLTNIGHDGSGVHPSAPFYNGETVESLPIERIEVVEDARLREDVDRIWRDGLLSIQENQSRRLRQIVAQWLAPMRRIGRRILRFFIPELAMFDAAAPQFSISPSSSRGSMISDDARVYPPYNIRESRVGSFSYIARNAWISWTRIGKFCSIGPNLVCGGGVHPTGGISTSPMFYSTRKQNGVSLCLFDKIQELKPIEIGNDVFIGANVTILDGVTIGDGAVIGAGCVVAKDVPPYAIVVGNPMRLLRYRFENEEIGHLKKIEWWNWQEDKLRKVERYFWDIKAFLSECDSSQKESE